MVTLQAAALSRPVSAHEEMESSLVVFGSRWNCRRSYYFLTRTHSFPAVGC